MSSSTNKDMIEEEDFETFFALDRQNSLSESKDDKKEKDAIDGEKSTSPFLKKSQAMEELFKANKAENEIPASPKSTSSSEEIFDQNFEFEKVAKKFYEYETNESPPEESQLFRELEKVNLESDTQIYTPLTIPENSPQSHEVKKPDSEAELFEYKDGLEGKAVKNKSKIKDPEAVTHERVQNLGFDSNESFIDVASLTSHSPDFDIKKILPDSKLKEDKEEIPSNKELQTYRPLITTNLSVKEKNSLKDDSVNPITSENTHFDESTSSSVENIRPPAIKDDNSSDNGNLDCDKTVM